MKTAGFVWFPPRIFSYIYFFFQFSVPTPLVKPTATHYLKNTLPIWLPPASCLDYCARTKLLPPALNPSSSLPTTKSRQSCPTLCDPIDGSPPGSRPWDSPGKNTEVSCHFLLQCMKVKSESEVAQSVWLLVTPWTAAYRLLHPWDFPGKSTGVGSSSQPL